MHYVGGATNCQACCERHDIATGCVQTVELNDKCYDRAPLDVVSRSRRPLLAESDERMWIQRAVKKKTKPPLIELCEFAARPITVRGVWFG